MQNLRVYVYSLSSSSSLLRQSKLQNIFQNSSDLHIVKTNQRQATGLQINLTFDQKII